MSNLESSHSMILYQEFRVEAQIFLKAKTKPSPSQRE